MEFNHRILGKMAWCITLLKLPPINFLFHRLIYFLKGNRTKWECDWQSTRVKRNFCSCLVQACNKSSTQSLTCTLTNWKWKSFPSWQIMFSLPSGFLSALCITWGRWGHQACFLWHQQQKYEDWLILYIDSSSELNWTFEIIEGRKKKFS